MSGLVFRPFFCYLSDRMNRLRKWLWSSVLAASLTAFLPHAEAMVRPMHSPDPITAGIGQPSFPECLPSVGMAAEKETLILADDSGCLWMAEYAGKNPYTGEDVYVLSPLGLYVAVFMAVPERPTDRTLVRIEMEFHFPAEVRPETRRQWMDYIENTWRGVHGRYLVLVSAKEARASGLTINEVHIMTGKEWAEQDAITPGVEAWAGDNDVWLAHSSDGQTIAHEAGHLMGLLHWPRYLARVETRLVTGKDLADLVSSSIRRYRKNIDGGKPFKVTSDGAKMYRVEVFEYEPMEEYQKSIMAYGARTHGDTVLESDIKNVLDFANSKGRLTPITRDQFINRIAP